MESPAFVKVSEQMDLALVVFFRAPDSLIEVIIEEIEEEWKQAGCGYMFLLVKRKKNFLTLKAPIMTAAGDIHKYFFIVLQRK